MTFNKDNWTRQELTLKKDGYIDLIIAIIKQWVDDGKPVSDLPQIKLWVQLLDSYVSKGKSC